METDPHLVTSRVAMRDADDNVPFSEQVGNFILVSTKCVQQVPLCNSEALSLQRQPGNHAQLAAVLQEAQLQIVYHENFGLA